MTAPMTYAPNVRLTVPELCLSARNWAVRALNSLCPTVTVIVGPKDQREGLVADEDDAEHKAIDEGIQVGDRLSDEELERSDEGHSPQMSGIFLDQFMFGIEWHVIRLLAQVG